MEVSFILSVLFLLSLAANIFLINKLLATEEEIREWEEDWLIANDLRGD